MKKLMLIGKVNSLESDNFGLYYDVDGIFTTKIGEM